MKSLVLGGKARVTLAVLSVIVLVVSFLPVLSVNVLGSELMTISGFNLAFGKSVTILGTEVQLLSSNVMMIAAYVALPVVVILLNLLRAEVIDDESVTVFTGVIAVIGAVLLAIGLSNIETGNDVIANVSYSFGTPIGVAAYVLIIIVAVYAFMVNNYKK